MNIKQELREAIKKSEFYVKSTFDHATDRYDAVENFITALLPIIAKYEEKILKDIKYMATFRCEHGDDCYKQNRGGVCNSCWVRSWATSQIIKGKE